MFVCVCVCRYVLVWMVFDCVLERACSVQIGTAGVNNDKLGLKRSQRSLLWSGQVLDDVFVDFTFCFLHLYLQLSLYYTLLLHPPLHTTFSTFTLS